MRNLVNNMLKQEKKNYVESLLSKNAGNPGALWKTLKNLTNCNINDGITLDLSGEHITNPKQVAEEFNEYFIKSVNELTNCFESNADNNDKSRPKCQMETESSTDPFDLPIITAEFVRNEIKHLSTSKATGNDEISVKIMKLVVDIPVVIHSLINLHLQFILNNGVFSHSLENSSGEAYFQVRQ